MDSPWRLLERPSTPRLRRRLRTRSGTRSHSTPARPCVTPSTDARRADRADRGGRRERADQISDGGGSHSPLLVQHHRRPAVSASAGAPPGNGQAGRAGRSLAALSDGADRPGSERRTAYRDPAAGPRHLPHVAPDAAVPRPAAREGARHERAHFLQIRGGEPRRQPQAEHRGRPGLLQQGRGRQEARDRNRRRAVGLVARLRRRFVRPRSQGLHGQGLLQPEALPAGADGDLWR